MADIHSTFNWAVEYLGVNGVDKAYARGEKWNEKTSDVLLGNLGAAECKRDIIMWLVDHGYDTPHLLIERAFKKPPVATRQQVLNNIKQSTGFKKNIVFKGGNPYLYAGFKYMLEKPGYLPSDLIDSCAKLVDIYKPATQTEIDEAQAHLNAPEDPPPSEHIFERVFDGMEYLTCPIKYTHVCIRCKKTMVLSINEACLRICPQNIPCVGWCLNSKNKDS